jgi:hypothetical protein
MNLAEEFLKMAQVKFEFTVIHYPEQFSIVGLCMKNFRV